MFNWKRKSTTELVETSDSKFQTGERWSYQTRPSEKGSTFIVLRIETMPNGNNVVHIRVEGLTIKNPQAPTGLTEVAEHLPFDESALVECALQRVESGLEVPLPEGYLQWRQEWQKGKAGVFTIPLAEVALFLQGVLNPSPSEGEALH